MFHMLYNDVQGPASDPARYKAPTLLVFASVLGFSVPAVALPGDTVAWSFDLPATAIASQNPPYPTVASMILLETGDGVQFTLAPTWNEPPSGRFGPAAWIERVDYVYGGSPLTDFTPAYPAETGNTGFRWDAGAPVRSFDFASSSVMDSGYKSDAGRITIDFFGRNRDPAAARFDDTFENSVWTVLGASLADFTGFSATANSKPSPIQAILSVAGYSLEALSPTPSNWVSASGSGGGDSGGSDVPTNPVPAPGLASLLGIGLLVLGAARRRVSD